MAKIQKAASDLEGIISVARQVVLDLRNGEPNAYARVYWLRAQLGYVVRTLGAGVPSELSAVSKEYDALFTPTPEAKPKDTWAFFYGHPGESLPTQVSTGMSTEDMEAHVDRVMKANGPWFLRLLLARDGRISLSAVGGPNDGSRWVWAKEERE